MLLWRIELLGGLRAVGDGQVVTRFHREDTRRLLAYLACHLGLLHRRDDTAAALWPERWEKCPAAVRRDLRVALAELRRHLELPGEGVAKVVLADHVRVGLNPELCTTDVQQFEATCKAAERRATEEVERAEHLAAAVALYHGPLLPEHQEEWKPISATPTDGKVPRGRPVAREHYERRGELEAAVEYARRAVETEPTSEEDQHELIRLLVAEGRPDAARRQFRELERALSSLDANLAPLPDTEALLVGLPGRRGTGANARTADGNGRSRPGSKASAHAVTEVMVTAAAAPARGSLPARLTRFFGRAAEREQLAALLTAPDTRLVTLTGPGGSGKTRLALETAWEQQSQFPGGVWFAALADLEDPRRVPDKLLDALRLPRSPISEPLEQVIAALAAGPALLVLDNFERLVEGGAEGVATLLERTPTLTCLVTSRKLLRLVGEQDFSVAPLPIPVVGANQSEETASTTDYPLLSTIPSVALFLDRARAVRPAFAVTAHNAAAVAELCCRLEGIPLALELAAARMSSMTPAHLLNRLRPPFVDLRTRRQNVDERHRSLWDTLAWSYNLLLPELQQFFRRLSVFRGGWTVDAAMQVCEDARAEEHLEQLRECSLVSVEPDGEEPRYRMLETLREFGAEQLTDAERIGLGRLHARYFLQLAEKGDAQLRGPDAKMWLDRLDMEHDNFRSVLEWAGSEVRASELEDSAAMGLRLATALSLFWQSRGHVAEGRQQLAALLALKTEERHTLDRIRAACESTWLAVDQGEGADTIPHFIECRLMAERQADDRTLLRALLGLARVHEGIGAYEQAEEYSISALETARAKGSTPDTIGALFELGLVRRQRGDPQGSMGCFSEALSLCRQVGHARGIAYALYQLAHADRRRGEMDKARSLLEESLKLFRELGVMPDVSLTLCQLGFVLERCGETNQARSYYAESLAIERELANEARVASALHSMGALALREGEVTEAQALLCQALAGHRASGNRWGTAATLKDLGYVALAQDDIDKAAAQFAEGLKVSRGMNDPQGIAAAMVGLSAVERGRGNYDVAGPLIRESIALWDQLECYDRAISVFVPLAQTLHALNQSFGAAVLLAAFVRQAEVMGVVTTALDRGTFDTLVPAVREYLGEQTFAKAWADGQEMSLVQAIRYAIEVT